MASATGRTAGPATKCRTVFFARTSTTAWPSSMTGASDYEPDAGDDVNPSCQSPVPDPIPNRSSSAGPGAADPGFGIGTGDGDWDQGLGLRIGIRDCD